MATPVADCPPGTPRSARREPIVHAPAEVKRLQEALGLTGDDVDKIFGPKTAGLARERIADPKVKAALDALTQKLGPKRVENLLAQKPRTPSVACTTAPSGIVSPAAPDGLRQEFTRPAAPPPAAAAAAPTPAPAQAEPVAPPPAVAMPETGGNQPGVLPSEPLPVSPPHVLTEPDSFPQMPGPSSAEPDMFPQAPTPTIGGQTSVLPPAGPNDITVPDFPQGEPYRMPEPGVRVHGFDGFQEPDFTLHLGPSPAILGANEQTSIPQPSGAQGIQSFWETLGQNADGPSAPPQRAQTSPGILYASPPGRPDITVEMRGIMTPPPAMARRRPLGPGNGPS